jgi:hypothetical protein
MERMEQTGMMERKELKELMERMEQTGMMERKGRMVLKVELEKLGKKVENEQKEQMVMMGKMELKEN